MAYQKIYFKIALFTLVISTKVLGVENYGAYITPMCYTKTQQGKSVTNPCYVCHTNGNVPNFFNELDLQQNYLFPKKMMKNPYKNLFKDRSENIKKISDEFIIDYIRKDNYTRTLKKKYNCYFNFDEDGFDRDDKGNLTLWRAFRYKPFMGTFFPTNGSFDDVIIRLPKIFALDAQNKFDIEIYKKNLDIVVHNIKNTTKKSYVAKASSIKAELGLYPVGVEFLHSLRYIDFDKKSAKPSSRFKELRYGKKYKYVTYSELEYLANKELHDDLDEHGLPAMQSYKGDSINGFDNYMGWRYSGYIEDEDGELRVQNDEETLSCIGCHAKLGVTTDSTFALQRKSTWGYQTLESMGDKNDEYKNYLMQNPTGNEYGTNDEVLERFFNKDKTKKQDAFSKLKKDIRVLLIPSYERAMKLNKAYYLLVKEQSFIYGKEATVKPLKNVHKEIEEIDTGVKKILINNIK
jgi:hypothetical protein